MAVAECCDGVNVLLHYFLGEYFNFKQSLIAFILARWHKGERASMKGRVGLEMNICMVGCLFTVKSEKHKNVIRHEIS